MNINQDERERAIFRSRRKFQTDLQLDLATAEDRGRNAGRREGKLEFARNLKKMGMSPNQISTATGLSLTELENLH